MTDVLAKNAQRVHHIVLPIQSGSEKILQAMRREYTVKEAADSIRALESVAPNIALSTHVIVGFPGETEKDFEDTISFLKRISFKHIIAHCYSDRPNTDASKIFPKVQDAEKVNRLWRLRKEFPVICRIRI